MSKPEISMGSAGRPPAKTGRPHPRTLRLVRAQQRMFLEHAEDALNTLVNLMHGSEEDGVRLRAATEILDRGFGKAVQTQLMRQAAEEGTGQITIDATKLKDADTEKLMGLLGQLNEFLQKEQGEIPAEQVDEIIKDLD